MELESAIFLLIILTSLAVAVRVFFKRKERQYLNEVEYGAHGLTYSKPAAPTKRVYEQSSKSKIDSLFPELEEERRVVVAKPIVRRGEIEIASNAPIATKSVFSHRDEAAMSKLKKMKQQAVENVRLKYGDETKSMPKLESKTQAIPPSFAATQEINKAEPLKEEKATAKEEPSAVDAFNKTMGFEKKKEEEKKKQEDKDWQPTDFFNG